MADLISEVDMRKVLAAAVFASIVFVGGNSPVLAQRDPNPQNDPDVRRGYNDTKERILQDEMAPRTSESIPPANPGRWERRPARFEEIMKKRTGQKPKNDDQGALSWRPAAL